MKMFRVIQFATATAVFSLGCVALLAGAPYVIGTVCFGLPAVILMGRAAVARPIRRREFLVGIGFLAVLVVAVIFLKQSVSDSVGERAVRNPAFVVPLWVLLMSGLFWRWRKERRQSGA